MNNLQLFKILGTLDPCTRKNFLGVFSADSPIKKPFRKKHFFIINSHPFPKPGHWQGVYLEYSKNNKYKGEVFCSFGLDPLSANLKNYLNQYCTSWIKNDHVLQNISEITCGHYCVFYILYRCRNYKLQEIVHYLLKQENSDKYVTHFINKLLNK